MYSTTTSTDFFKPAVISNFDIRTNGCMLINKNDQTVNKDRFLRHLELK